MPIPKGQQKKFKETVAANINRGKAPVAAKKIADKAIKHKKDK
jgi:hypothetical protein